MKKLQLSVTPRTHVPDGCIRLGVVVVENGQGIERDLQLFSTDRLQIHVSRCRSYEGLDREQAVANIAVAASLLPSTVQAIGYACTSGSYGVGASTVFTAIKSARPRVIPTSVSDSLECALTALSIKRLSMLTPYDLRLTEDIAGDISKGGALVSDVGYMSIATDADIAAIGTKEIIAAALQVINTSTSQAIFIACNAFRSVQAIGQIEVETGKIVLTSTQVVIWNLLRLSGSVIAPPSANFGQLFNSLRASPLP